MSNLLQEARAVLESNNEQLDEAKKQRSSEDIKKTLKKNPLPIVETLEEIEKKFEKMPKFSSARKEAEAAIKELESWFELYKNDIYNFAEAVEREHKEKQNK